MSATVTLHIFSGRPDPAWELSPAQISDLVDRIRSIQNTTTLKPPGIIGLLGYRGFTIRSVGERNIESEIYIHAGIVDLARFDLNLQSSDLSIESWLLATGEPYIEGNLFGQIQPQVTSAGVAPMAAFAPLAIPPYDPGKWNNNPSIRTQNNCYNYANDKITNTFAQPGRGSGQMYTSIDCGNVGAAAQRDGQISIPNPNITPADGHIAALVVAPGYDYHWYRRDNNGMWSHKPGQTAARNTDNSGRLISDPQNCDRGPYSIFCGFYHSIPSRTRIN